MGHWAKYDSTFYYASWQSKTDIVDSNGYATGEYVNVYSAPVMDRGMISGATGTVDYGNLGVYENYDKIILVNRPTPVVKEADVLFIDTVPTAGSSAGFDYVVKKIVSASFLHFHVICADKVESA